MRVVIPTTSSGFAELVRWASAYGELGQVGIEGTGSYGAGLARWLRARSVAVVEVDRPDRRTRRRRGKSDTVDAEAAARAVLAGIATAQPKAGTGSSAAEIHAHQVVLDAGCLEYWNAHPIHNETGYYSPNAAPYPEGVIGNCLRAQQDPTILQVPSKDLTELYTTHCRDLRTKYGNEIRYCGQYCGWLNSFSASSTNKEMWKSYSGG